MSSQRYDRQIRIPKLGPAGQAKLEQSRVLVVGAGGLGSPVLQYLAAAGVGTLGIVDGDQVELSNLNRQVLHRTVDIGMDKVASAARAVGELNPDVRVQTHLERLDVERTAELAADYDLVVDAADSFSSKYALNDGALRAGKPLIHAGVEGMVGQLAVLGLPGGPCLRCVFPKPPPDPDEPRAILGAAAGVLGTLEATEALKVLAHLNEATDSKMLLVNLWRLQFHSVAIHRSAACPTCGSS